MRAVGKNKKGDKTRNMVEAGTQKQRNAELLTAYNTIYAIL